MDTPGFRAQIIVQHAKYGYPSRPMFETGGSKDWAPGAIMWDEDKTYRTLSAARGAVTRWTNQTGLAGHREAHVGRDVDTHGFRVRVYFYQGQSVMVRTRIMCLDHDDPCVLPCSGCEVDCGPVSAD